MNELIFLLYVAIVVLTTTAITVGSSARSMLLFLGVLYIVVFFLLLQVWPMGLALVFLLAGMISIVIMNMYTSDIDISIEPPRLALEVLLVLFTGIISFVFAPQLSNFLPISRDYLIIGFFLFVYGLLQAGLSTIPFRTMIYCFLFLLGFQVIYAPLEGSALVTAMISSIHVLFAFVVSRLLTNHEEAHQ